MTQNIHPTAIIDSAAKLGNGVSIGAYSVVGPDVTIGDDVKLHSHVVIDVTHLLVRVARYSRLRCWVVPRNTRVMMVRNQNYILVKIV